MTVKYQKVWRTMNDLEMVTSKICSAREIIDAAIDRIQEHQYDKAEMMMSAAYEFLEYYLQEFDDKFKLAWQATVSDLRDGDREAYDDVMKEKKYYEPQQYTEEELNAMCDKAASDEEKEKCREYNLREAEYYDKRAKLDMNYCEAVAAGWTMTDDGFWMPPQEKDKVKKWVLPVEPDPSGEYFVTFPDDLLEAANLKEGDQVEWVDNGDESYMIRKVTKILGPDDC